MEFQQPTHPPVMPNGSYPKGLLVKYFLSFSFLLQTIWRRHLNLICSFAEQQMDNHLFYSSFKKYRSHFEL